jgi:hypothetical protein
MRAKTPILIAIAARNIIFGIWQDKLPQAY